MTTKLLFIQALSPLHPGTGQGIDVIDLPIAREKSTGIPFLPGSSIKGVLRDAGEAKLEPGQVNAVFGASQLENAGAAVFTDARLTLLPVRSLAGTFAYVTSPYLLKRLARDAQSAGFTNVPAVPSPDLENCSVTSDTLEVQAALVVLEELDLIPQDGAVTWADWIAPKALNTDWQAFFRDRFCIVHDDVMSFLLETATEVVARIRLEDDTKTVAKGALWYEESLPVESVLVSLVQTSAERSARTPKLDADAVMTHVDSLMATPLQFGGKSSVGRGVCQLRLAGGA